MRTSPLARHIFLWLSLAVILVVTGALTGRVVLRAKAKRTPIAAYLVPIANNERMQPAWWLTQRLTVPRPLAAGERVRIPAGTCVTLIHAESGVAEQVVGPANVSFQQKLPVETNPLVSPLAEVIGAAQTSPASPPLIFAITSPVGMTRYLNPLITWTAREGVSYDVAVIDSADAFVPLRKAFGVRPPVALADLQTPQRHQLGADRNYEIIIREANSPTIAGGARFLTTTDAQLENQIPSTPAELIAEAAAAMAKKPTRTGDACLALFRLPSDWAASELGVRLRLRVATELGLADERAQALKDAAKLNAW